ncbi:MAG: hypothetical protein EB075_15465, partial [Bacteroidetes bacterium]|nr:hypothetical protein [Bacteroidota bacterium]
VYSRCLGATWIDVQQGVDPSPVNNPLYPNITAGTPDCLKSCREEPFYFESWEPNVAWVVCGLSRERCANWSIPYFPRFQEAAVNITRVLDNAVATGDADAVHAYSFCFWMTLSNVLPYALLAVTALYAVAVAVAIPFVLIATGIQFLMQALAYSHT